VPAGTGALQGEEHQRSQWLGPRWNGLPTGRTILPQSADDRVVVAAMGPVGHVYLPPLPLPLDRTRLGVIARQLIDEAKIPTILAHVDGELFAWNSRGDWRLPDDAAEVI